MHALESKPFTVPAAEDQFNAQRPLAWLHQGANGFEVVDAAEQRVLDGIKQAGLADVVLSFDDVDPAFKAQGRIPIAAEIAEPGTFDHGCFGNSGVESPFGTSVAGSSPDRFSAAISSCSRPRSFWRAAPVKLPAGVRLASSSSKNWTNSKTPSAILPSAAFKPG